MALPAIPIAYTAVASLLARKGATEAAKKYGPKAVKEVQKITAKMKKKSKVGKENEFEDTLGSTPASTKLNNRQVEKFLKEHGYKEKNPSKLKEGDISYQFKINNKGKEDILVYEKVGDKIKKTNFTNSSLRKLANWQGYAEGGVVENSLLTDDRIMYKDGGEFPDLSGDGIVTQKDILIGKGVIDREQKQEGGPMSMDDQMMMAMNMGETHTMPDGTVMPGATHEEYMKEQQLPDEQMEDNYLDFIVDEALSEEEEDMLMSKLEQDEQLSMLFDKVLEVASEFAGSGPVDGPGTGVSDSIPARLSDGEFVFTAKATEEIGADELMRMMKDAEAQADERQEMMHGGTIHKDSGEEEIQANITRQQVMNQGVYIPEEDTTVRDKVRENMMDPNTQSRYVRS